MRRPQNLKKFPTCFDKTAVFTQQCQNNWEIFNFLWHFQKSWISFGNSNMVKLHRIFFQLYRMQLTSIFNMQFKPKKKKSLKDHFLEALSDPILMIGNIYCFCVMTTIKYYQVFLTINWNGKFGLVFGWGEILLTYMIFAYAFRFIVILLMV